MRKHVTYLAVIALALGLAACDMPWEKNPTGPTQTQTTNVNVTVTQPAPAPVGPPAPGTPLTTKPITKLKIAFFEGTPCSGDKECTVGDKAPITATPYTDDGIDPCEGVENCPVYGQGDIKWILPSEGTSEAACNGEAGAVVQSSAVSGENFNRDIMACKPGSFTVRAVFKDSIPGEMTGTVVAASGAR